MGFKTIQYNIPHAIKATHFLLQCGYSKQDTQRLLDKKRVRQDNKVIQKSDMLSQGIVEILSFIPNDIGIMPFFACLPPHVFSNKTDSIMNVIATKDFPHFCIFNKPAKFLTHPKNLLDSNSMLDALRYHFGSDCNPCHRLDYETSGLLLCSIGKKSEVILKNLFLEHKVKKTYLAIVRGVVKKSMYIESNINFSKDFGNLCIKGVASNLKTTSIKNEQIDTIINNFTKQNINNKAASIMQPLQIFRDLNSLLDYLANNSHFLPLQYHNYIQNAKSQHIDSMFNNIYFYNMQEKVAQYELWLMNLSKNYPLDSIKKHKSIKNNNISSLNSNHSEQFSLVKLMPLSGKTHQLRIHTASIQHAILGDTLYGLHPVLASFFLDIQSKKAKHNIKSYLCETITKLHSSDIKQHYAIYAYKRVRSIAQKAFYDYYKQHFLQKDFLKRFNKKHNFIKYHISVSLSKILIPCFFSHDLIEEQEENIFFTFLLFYYGLPSKQEQILQDMRFYYCNSNRLLLHAFKLQLLDKSFICP